MNRRDTLNVYCVAGEVKVVDCT